jgi:hypothetical protein
MANYVIGYDIGKSVDPSACVVVERYQVIVPTPEGFEKRDGPKTVDHFRIAQLMELKHTPYEAQIDALSDLMSTPPLYDDAWLVYDATGVGAAFGAMVDVAWREGRLGRHFWPLGSSIVAGDGRPGSSVGVWQETVKKVDLVATLRLALEEKRVHIAVGLPGAEQWLKEMRAFTAKPQTTGNYTYENATASTHDDYVIATMFACHFHNWQSEPRYLDPQTGELREKD